MKYKGSVREELEESLYSSLPDTADTSFCREMSGLQSEVSEAHAADTVRTYKYTLPQFNL